MSTINTNNVGSTSAVTGAASLSSMSATDFLKIMTTQLANQDPTNPTSSTDLMQQLSTVYSLQSNQEMMKHQNLTSAAALIGCTITGLDTNGNQVQGVVNNMTIDSNGIANLVVGNSMVPLNNVTSSVNTGADMNKAALLVGSKIAGTDTSGNSITGSVIGVQVDNNGMVNLVVPVKQADGTMANDLVPVNSVTAVAPSGSNTSGTSGSGT